MHLPEGALCCRGFRSRCGQLGVRMDVGQWEVPLAEVLTYSQALTSMTGGRGDYHMSFLRYEEVPAHVAQKIIEETKKEREEAKA